MGLTNTERLNRVILLHLKGLTERRDKEELLETGSIFSRTLHLIDKMYIYIEPLPASIPDVSAGYHEKRFLEYKCRIEQLYQDAIVGKGESDETTVGDS